MWTADEQEEGREMAIEQGIRTAAGEFLPLFDELTTSDLQSVAQAQAIIILRGIEASRPDQDEIDTIADEILKQIYDYVDDMENGHDYGAEYQMDQHR